MKPEVDIFLTTHNHLNLTMSCLDALYRNTDIPFLLTVIDDSTDMTPQFLCEFSKERENVQILRPKIHLKSCEQMWNIALQNSNLPYVVAMVNSITVEPQWLDSALELMKRKEKAGVVGFKILNPWGTIQCTGVMGIHPNGMMAVGGKDEPGHRCTYVSEVAAVGGALWLFRREAIKEGFDENTYIGFRGWDDLDICLSLRKRGWDVLYCGYGSAYHIDSPTKKDNPKFWEEFYANKEKFMQRWEFVI